MPAGTEPGLRARRVLCLGLRSGLQLSKVARSCKTAFAHWMLRAIVSCVLGSERLDARGALWQYAGRAVVQRSHCFGTKLAKPKRGLHPTDDESKMPRRSVSYKVEPDKVSASVNRVCCCNA